MLKEGIKAPAFSLKDQDGKTHKLADYKGKKVVLYFYPKDNTPGCTTEACTFNENLSKLKKKAIIFGVSADSVESHKKFADKYGLKFSLLSDPDKKMLEKYEAYGKKKFMGKEYMRIHRITYLIDEQGKIKKVFPKVKPAEHAEEILDFL
ncbi:thioredoxin-dependent thiol peroxidase [Candidatus Woesearchaeota archaeon]|nr:thioredoxin-dependent thiol peroxidase [Candidatus Woesearchaeota archaeon]MCF7901052.1 thioredoxin-dependent thiol peroxidase [Candidatus Woesearchaeota archaeon]MCF8013949.1 thioredoxin-dependent thiol peroxidase [Candidatus Woesearchaeota archaeon]